LTKIYVRFKTGKARSGGKRRASSAGTFHRHRDPKKRRKKSERMKKNRPKPIALMPAFKKEELEA
jgi:hypothetical protein